MGKPKARPATRQAGKGKASRTQPGSNKAARPASGEEAGWEALPAPIGAADGGAKETDGAEIELAAAVLPRMTTTVARKSVAADAVVPAVERAAVLVSAGVSAAAFDAGSIAEVALSTSLAPVTPAALAAVVSAATGEHGDAPTAEGATTAVACAEMPTAAAAASRQEHGQAVGEFPGPANGDSSSAARAKSKKNLRAQPAPRRPGAGLGPGSPGPLLGWLLQGQPPSERAHRSSSAHMQEARGVSGLNEAAIETTATRHAEQPAPNQDNETHMHSPPGPVAPAAEAVATCRSARLGAVTWGPPRGGRTPWMPAGRAGLEATARPAPAAGRGFRGMGRGRRGGGRGGVARLGGAEIQARTSPWQERHDCPEVLEAAANREEVGSAEDTGDPEFMCGEEAGPESEEISLDNEEKVGRGRNRVRGAGEGVDEVTSQAEGVPLPGATVTNKVKSPATLAEDDAIWQAAGTWTLDLLQRMNQPFLVRRLPPQVLDKSCLCLLAPLLRLSTNPECPAAIQLILLSMATSVPEVAIVAYANDITIVGPREAACMAFNMVVTELASCGLRCNLTKSAAWCAVWEEGGDGLPRGLPIHPGGLKVLGSPVGSDAFCTDQVGATLAEAAAPLYLISQLNL
ncbi:unnamed protein product [Closterium sp. NIES-65]|nr:unnamed protein product [Closterium sp. NIES-65]